MTGESSLRAQGRRSTAPANHARCSCDLLLSLCQDSSVQAVLSGLVDPAALRRGVPDLHAETDSEPADWRLRISQRSAGRRGAGELELLLAIVRSADCHAYQLLERAGVACSTLRKRLIDQLREAENRAAHSSTPRTVPTRQSQLAAPARVLPLTDALPTPARRRVSAPVPEDSPERPLTRPVPTDSSARGPRRAPPLAEPSPTRRARDLRPVPEDSPNHRAALADPDDRDPQPHDPQQGERRDEPRPDSPAPQAGDRSTPRPELRPSPRLTAIDPRKLAPLHARDATLARLADALLRRSPRPPLLVGPHGSGRTLVASHLARVINAPVFHIDAADHPDEDSLRAELAVVARQRGVAILDDLDQLGGDAPPNILPALVKIWSSGQPPLLTIVSPEGRARLEAWLPGLASTFDVLDLPALEGEALRAAVSAAAPAVLAEHDLSLAPGARLAELTRLAERFLGGLAMPGRALDLLDLACARSVREGRRQVTRDTWIDIVCERSGVPRERIEGLGGQFGDQEMLDLESELHRQVVGHDPAIKALCQLIRRNRAGFSSQRPVATVLLLGPSGVGKTEIAKALCGALFDRQDALVRLDMSEYAESHAVARVIGAPPGYVGHEQGGALTDPLLRQPHCVVLLDEIEKAHRDVHQLLLQVLDEGRLTDGRGRTVDFRHAVLIMTSNLGAASLLGDDPDSETRALETARAAFPVELWNRIEAPLVLHPLAPAELATICARLVRASSERLFRERGIRFKLSERACRHVVGLCERDTSLGARPLRHVLTRVVEARVADAILRGQVRAGMQVEVDVDNEVLVLATTRA
jgi:ATP-dependent Clp protease ATP-binding subunit ClpC